ncbi:LOW QUALITY PROTEIN: E3 ubiquitin/ISG15 ligase TRIM25-like [Anomaloglossus baeobatrachus]
MASASMKEELTCSVCLNIYTDPVSLKCGHSFCQECIENVRKAQLGSSSLTCPECREEVQELPSLQKNARSNISKHFLSVQQERKTADIFCTYCIHCSVAAVKSCLLCEAALCEDHLKVHSKSTDHILIEPITSTVNRKCSTHEKVLMYYCTKDATCVCFSCGLAGEHKGHQIESLTEASKKKKESLKQHLGHLTSKRQEMKRSLETLKDLKTDMSEKAACLKDKITTVFRDVRRQLDLLEKKVFCEISSQEERASLSVSDLIGQLEIKKDELSREIHHLEELCRMTDPLALLQAGSSSSSKGEISDKSEKMDILQSIKGFDEGLIAATLYKGLADIVTSIKRRAYIPVDPHIFLDVETAANSLDVSVDLRFASCVVQNNLLNTPTRFQFHQVLCTKSFSTGQHYWEVETRRTGTFRLGVAYATIERKGQTSAIGNNKKSWCLCRLKNTYSINYDNRSVTIPHIPSSQTIAMYLDYEAGHLSFYDLSGTILHLHTVKTTFTEPVYPAFLIWEDCWLRILN